MGSGRMNQLRRAPLSWLCTLALCSSALAQTPTWQTWSYFPPPSGPLQAANMLSALIAADVVATANITLSGVQTIDGQAVSQGQIVLAQAQSTAANNGLWVVQSGAWTRPINFPTGYVIAQNCEIVFLVKLGTNFSNTHWFVATAGGALTIGTSALSITAVAATATNTRLGTVRTSGTGAVVSNISGTTITHDCTSFNDATGTVVDLGDVNNIKGPCAVENTNTGHLVLQNGGFPPAASAGTLNTNSTDHWGVITGLSAATTVTLTFASAWPNSVASCSANDSAGTAVGVSYTTSAGTITAATFTMTALTGSLSYLCFGTN